jgi:hypothetical protein
MTNKLKGEVTVTIGDRDLIVVYSTDALIELETRFGKGVQEIGQMLIDSLRVSDMRTIFRAGLIEYQPEITEQEAGRLMSQMGLLQVGELVTEAFGLAFDAGLEAAKAARPSRPPVTAGRKGGTGTRAATSGLNSSSATSALLAR